MAQEAEHHQLEGEALVEAQRDRDIFESEGDESLGRNEQDEESGTWRISNMSSEYTIHLEDAPITEKFNHLGKGFQMVTVKLRLGEARILLFVRDRRRKELAEVLRKVAQSLSPGAKTVCPCYEEGHRIGYEDCGAEDGEYQPQERD